MTSKLGLSDFKNRLSNHTKIGDPKIKGTPFAIFTIFGQSGKKFYGDFDNSSFQLTENASFFPLPYVIKGTFKSQNNSETRLSYKIKPIWFGFLWVRILPILALILINGILLTQNQRIETEIILIINIFLLFMFLPILILNYKKKRMEKEFREIFKIKD